MNIFKNTKLLIGVVLVALVLLGGWFIASKRGGEKAIEQVAVEENIETISSEELGLTLSVRQNGRAVRFEITNTEGIDSLDYELSYFAKGDIPRGVIGHTDVTPGKKVVSDDLVLGTCSASVCKYDEGVKTVKLVLRINKTDGKILQAEKELEL